MSTEVEAAETALTPEEEEKLGTIIDLIRNLDRAGRPQTIPLISPKRLKHGIWLLHLKEGARMAGLLATLPPASEEELESGVFDENEWRLLKELRRKLGIPGQLRERIFFIVRDTFLNLPFLEPTYGREPRNPGDPIEAGFSRTKIIGLKSAYWHEYFVGDDFGRDEFIVITVGKNY